MSVALVRGSAKKKRHSKFERKLIVFAGHGWAWVVQGMPIVAMESTCVTLSYKNGARQGHAILGGVMFVRKWSKST